MLNDFFSLQNMYAINPVEDQNKNCQIFMSSSITYPWLNKHSFSAFWRMFASEKTLPSTEQVYLIKYNSINVQIYTIVMMDVGCWVNLRLLP